MGGGTSNLLGKSPAAWGEALIGGAGNMPESSIWPEYSRRNGESETQWLLRALLQSLECLAAEAETVIRAYPPEIPVADDLANEFDTRVQQARRCVEEGLISEQALKSIETVLSEISQMTERRDPSMWTNQALHFRPEWAAVRRLAREVLATLGFELEPPPPWSGTSTPA